MNKEKLEKLYKKFLLRIQARAKHVPFESAVKLALADYSGSKYKKYYIQKLKEQYPEIFI